MHSQPTLSELCEYRDEDVNELTSYWNNWSFASHPSNLSKVAKQGYRSDDVSLKVRKG